MEDDMGPGEVKAVVQADISDSCLYRQAVETSSSFQDEVVEQDMPVSEGGKIDVEVEEVVAGVDTAAEAGVVKARKGCIEQVDIVFDFFGRDNEAEILVGGDGFGGLDIAGIIFIEEGLEGGGEVLDGEFADDGAVELVADDGDGLVVVDHAGFEVEGVEGHALAILINRCVVDAGGAEEVIDIVAGEIAFEFAIEFDLFVDEVETVEVGFSYFGLEIESRLGTGEVDQAVEVRGEVGVIDEKFPVKFLLCHGAVHLNVLIGVVIKFQAADRPIEGCTKGSGL